jgi:hypothetical protein
MPAMDSLKEIQNSFYQFYSKFLSLFPQRPEEKESSASSSELQKDLPLLRGEGKGDKIARLFFHRTPTQRIAGAHVFKFWQVLYMSRRQQKGPRGRQKTFLLDGSYRYRSNRFCTPRGTWDTRFGSVTDIPAYKPSELGCCYIQIQSPAHLHHALLTSTLYYAQPLSVILPPRCH